MLIYFLDKALSITNLFHQNKHFTTHSTVKFCNVYVNLFVEKISLSTQHFWNSDLGGGVLEKYVLVLNVAPYSSDLVTCDFFIFLKVKFSLSGNHLKTFRAI
jgi:hypothetical protein